MESRGSLPRDGTANGRTLWNSMGRRTVPELSVHWCVAGRLRGFLAEAGTVAKAVQLVCDHACVSGLHGCECHGRRLGVAGMADSAMNTSSSTTFPVSAATLRFLL